jgi:hypothetical protein
MFDDTTELPVEVFGDADLQSRLIADALAAEVSTARLLSSLGEWDDRRVWMVERGAAPKGFLVLETGMAPAQAAAHLSTARALRLCPLTAAALADGRLSVAKARLLAVFGAGRRVHEAFLTCEADIIDHCLGLDVEHTALYLKIW